MRRCRLKMLLSSLRLSLVNDEAVSLGVARKARPARGKLVNLRYFGARVDNALPHAFHVVDFESCSHRCSGRYSEFFGRTVQCKGRISEIELNPKIVEPLAGP